jgi:hypothetical protein
MWWTDGLRSDDGQVGAAAVCKDGNQWRSCSNFLGTGCTEVFDAELRALGLALDETIEKRETSQRHGVMTVAVFHQEKMLPSGRNRSVRVDVLCQSRQRHPGGGLLRTRGQFNASRSISPSDRCFTVSSRSVGLLF